MFTYSHAFPAIGKASLSISRKCWRVKCVYLLVISTGPWRVNVGKVWLRIWGLWRRRLKIKGITDQDAGDIRCVGCCLFHWVMREDWEIGNKNEKLKEENTSAFGGVVFICELFGFYFPIIFLRELNIGKSMLLDSNTAWWWDSSPNDAVRVMLPGGEMLQRVLGPETV